MKRIFLDTDVIMDFLTKREPFSIESMKLVETLSIQNYCAEENRIFSIVTRNVKDYAKSSLAIQTPKEFITEFEKHR